MEGYSSRAAIARQTGPYQSAVTAPIADWSAPLSAELAADIDDASRALADFDNYTAIRLGGDDQTLGPMAAILPRTESASSSQIEHLTSSAMQLALAELREGDRANAAEVVANVRAMEAAIALADRLDADAILTMLRVLTSPQADMSEHAGRFRQQPVWIGGRDSAGQLGADGVAPQHELVPDAIGDLVAFIGRDDVPVLAQTAIAHAQFETFHPFVDSNGRTGRALAHAMLRAKGLTRNQTVPISAGLLTAVDSYFDALAAYRAGDAAPIVRRFASATRYAAVTGRELVDDLAGVLEAGRNQLAGLRSQAAAWRLLPKLIQQPVVNMRYVAAALDGVDNKAALRAVDALVARGVLVERTGRARAGVAAPGCAGGAGCVRAGGSPGSPGPASLTRHDRPAALEDLCARCLVLALSAFVGQIDRLVVALLCGGRLVSESFRVQVVERAPRPVWSWAFASPRRDRP